MNEDELFLEVTKLTPGRNDLLLVTVPENVPLNRNSETANAIRKQYGCFVIFKRATDQIELVDDSKLKVLGLQRIPKLEDVTQLPPQEVIALLLDDHPLSRETRRASQFADSVIIRKAYGFVLEDALNLSDDEFSDRYGRARKEALEFFVRAGSTEAQQALDDID